MMVGVYKVVFHAPGQGWEDFGVPKSSELASMFVPSIVSRSWNFPSLYHGPGSLLLWEGWSICLLYPSPTP